MLKLMYITNSPEVASIADGAGVDRIFIDLEQYGKEKRQKNWDSVKSKHSIFGYPESEIGGQKRADIRAHRPDF